MKKTLVVDSSQIVSFLDCPTLWSYSYLQNIGPREVKPKEAMIKGTYGHKLLEIYYKNRAIGQGINESISAACNHNVDNDTNCECGHGRQSHSKILNLETCSLCSGTNNYFHSFKHQQFPLSQPLRLSIQDRFRQHCLIHSANDFRPHSPKTVEVGFSEKIYEDSEHLFVLEGKIDVLGYINSGENIIVDHKFQERAHTLYKKSIQFRNYSLITGMRDGRYEPSLATKLMIINYIRMAKSADKPFERTLVSFSADEHQWWLRELIKIFFAMLTHKESGFSRDDSHRWNHCKGDWGYPCEFSSLCEERNNERVKLIMIQQNFTKKEEWRPW